MAIKKTSVEKKEPLKTEEQKLVPTFDVVELNRHLVGMMKDDPFFCSISRFIRKVESSVIPTAAVSFSGNEFVMYWNPFFFEKLNTNEVKGVFKHEYYHVILGHITSRKRDNHVIWNIATDLAINSLLKENGTQLPECCLMPGKAVDIPKDRKLKEEEKNAIKFSKFIASLPLLKASEWYYEEIMNFLKKNNMEAPTYVATLDDHSGWDKVSDAERDYINGRVRQAIGEAVRKADQSNSWGSVPAAIREKLRELYSNEVDWRSLLRNFCGTSRGVNNSHSMKKINRKYPYIHPGPKRSYSANIGIFVDQSGSVSNDDISLFFSELNNLAKRMDFTLHFFDTAVDKDNKIKWRRGQKVQPMRTRCGGTDFQAVVNYVNESPESFDGVLILSDGECGQPSPCKTKLAWIICPNNKLLFEPRSNEVLIQMKKSIEN